MNRIFRDVWAVRTQLMQADARPLLEAVETYPGSSMAPANGLTRTALLVEGSSRGHDGIRLLQGFSFYGPNRSFPCVSFVSAVVLQVSIFRFS
jgi:hypothetical protein